MGRSKRRVTEAARYLQKSCSSPLLPHYNSHLMVKNISSIKAFLSPSPPHVLCEFSSGDFSYSERIYFQGDLIVAIIPEGSIPDSLIPVPKQGFMTALIMLGYA